MVRVGLVLNKCHSVRPDNDDVMRPVGRITGTFRADRLDNIVVICLTGCITITVMWPTRRIMPD